MGERALVGPEIEAAWLGGNYSRARFLLESLESSPQRDLHLAQVYLRVNQHDDLIALLSPRLGDYGAHERARAHAYIAVSYAARNMAREAREAIALARAGEPRGRDAAAEVTYNDALVAYMLGDLMHASNCIGQEVATGCPDMDAALAARYFMLRAWLFAAKEDYGQQATALVEAIARLEAAPKRDAGLLAWCVYPLAALVRDIDVPDALAVVLRIEGTLPWTADLAMAHFQTVRAVAWAYTLQGEYILAFRKFDAATALAPNPIAKMLVHIDHALCAQFSGQSVVAQAQSAELDELLRTYDWSKAVWEEARALIGGAEVLAAHDPARARELLAQARELQPSMLRNAGYAHDRRLDAHADYAEALQRDAAGDRRVAMHRAERAYDVFSQIGYRWYAARCAHLLYRLGGNERWLAAAREHIEVFPRSFVGGEVEKSVGKRDPYDTLTARQREIVARLREGKTNEEIGAELRITANTVRVHITRIHHAFGVERRSQLLRELSRRDSAA